jgi:hypothetical protein
VLFKDVAAINIATVLQNLEVRESVSHAADLETFGPLLRERKVFAVCADDFEGWIIAGAVYVHQDDCEYHDPSAIFPS